jgi:hypothetical protein
MRTEAGQGCRGTMLPRVTKLHLAAGIYCILLREIDFEKRNLDMNKNNYSIWL